MPPSEARFPLRAEWLHIQELPRCERTGELLLAVGSVPYQDPLVAFPLRSEWDALHPVDAEPFPEPLRASTDPGCTPEYPVAIQKLQWAAQGAGWACQVTHAVGHLPHASYGTPSADAKESFALRMTRGTDRAVAVLMGSTWTLLRRSSRMFRPYASLAAFTDDLAGVMIDRPSGTEWAKMLVKYPLKPNKAQRTEMERLNEAHREARPGIGVCAPDA